MTRPKKKDNTIIDLIQGSSEAEKGTLQTLMERKYMNMDAVVMTCY